MIPPRAYRIVTIALAGLFGLLGVVAIVITTDAFWARPVTVFKWQDIRTEAVCNATVLGEPDISISRVVDFASDAGVTLNSFDYYNQATVIGSALRQYFTINGRQSYVNEINRTGSPLVFRRNYVEQTAYKNGVPNVREEGFIQGRRFWRVEVPLKQYRRSNVDMTENQVLLTMLIVRVRPSPDNPNGIGIDSIVAQAMLASTYGTDTY